MQKKKYHRFGGVYLLWTYVQNPQYQHSVEWGISIKNKAQETKNKK